MQLNASEKIEIDDLSSKLTQPLAALLLDVIWALELKVVLYRDPGRTDFVKIYLDPYPQNEDTADLVFVKEFVFLDIFAPLQTETGFSEVVVMPPEAAGVEETQRCLSMIDKTNQPMYFDLCNMLETGKKPANADITEGIFLFRLHPDICYPAIKVNSPEDVRLAIGMLLKERED